MVHYFINLVRNRLRYVFKITSDTTNLFQKASWATLPVVVRTHNWIKVQAGDDIIMQRITHNNMKSNANWFPVMLTDTDVNIFRWNIIRIEILIYGRQRVDYWNQDDITCLVPQSTCYGTGLRKSVPQWFQGNDQELRPQPRFFKKLGANMVNHLAYFVKVELQNTPMIF